MGFRNRPQLSPADGGSSELSSLELLGPRRHRRRVLRSRTPYGPRQVNANRSIRTVPVDTVPTTSTRALKRSPEPLDMMSVCVYLKIWPLSTNGSVP